MRTRGTTYTYVGPGERARAPILGSGAPGRTRRLCRSGTPSKAGVGVHSGPADAMFAWCTLHRCQPVPSSVALSRWRSVTAATRPLARSLTRGSDIRCCYRVTLQPAADGLGRVFPEGWCLTSYPTIRCASSPNR